MSQETTKLILVEDDRWLADCLSETLHGFSIKKITDPEKVFIEIESDMPDLILADITLGRKNIFVLLNEMQSYSDTRDIPIIILSSAASRLNLTDLEPYGVRSIIDKVTATPDEISTEILHAISDTKGGK